MERGTRTRRWLFFWRLLWCSVCLGTKRGLSLSSPSLLVSYQRLNFNSCKIVLNELSWSHAYRDAPRRPWDDDADGDGWIWWYLSFSVVSSLLLKHSNLLTTSCSTLQKYKWNVTHAAVVVIVECSAHGGVQWNNDPRNTSEGARHSEWREL